MAIKLLCEAPNLLAYAVGWVTGVCVGCRGRLHLGPPLRLGSGRSGADHKARLVLFKLSPVPDLHCIFQESGRAGRDGLPAQSVLYYGVEDRRRMDALLAKGDRRHARKRPQPGAWTHGDLLLSGAWTPSHSCHRADYLDV